MACPCARDTILPRTARHARSYYFSGPLVCFIPGRLSHESAGARQALPRLWPGLFIGNRFQRSDPHPSGTYPSIEGTELPGGGFVGRFATQLAGGGSAFFMRPRPLKTICVRPSIRLYERLFTRQFWALPVLAKRPLASLFRAALWRRLWSDRAINSKFSMRLSFASWFL